MGGDQAAPRRVPRTEFPRALSAGGADPSLSPHSYIHTLMDRAKKLLHLHPDGKRKDQQFDDDTGETENMGVCTVGLPDSQVLGFPLE